MGEWVVGEDACAARTFARSEFVSSTFDLENVARRMTGGPPDMMFLQAQHKDDKKTRYAYEVESTSFIIAEDATRQAGMDRGFCREYQYQNDSLSYKQK